MNTLTPLAHAFVKAMHQFGRDGHTHAPVNALMDTVRARHTASDADLAQALADAVDGGVLVKTTLHQDTVIYVPSVYQMEKSAAKRLALMTEKALPPVSSSTCRHVLKRIRQTTTLSDEQLRAVHGTLQHKITVLTGGPAPARPRRCAPFWMLQMPCVLTRCSPLQPGRRPNA